MYITILDFNTGRVVIHKINKNIDGEDYVSEHFGLDNTEWMVTEELTLDFSTKQQEI
jgi:hypothetical protein